MRLIGCDLHASQQSIAMLDRDADAVIDKTLTHEGETVREFYARFRGPLSWELKRRGRWVGFLVDGGAGHRSAV